MSRTIIRGGTLVTPDGIRKADIRIDNESIVEVSTNIQDPNANIVDASGLHIFPGLIDAHVHLRDPGATQKEDFASGTGAALAGGVTTILDMPNNPVPTTSRQTLEEKRLIASSKAVCDFGLFVGATGQNAGDMGDWGAIGVKLYMGATTGDLLVTDFDATYRHFVAPHSLPIVVHAEDNQALSYFAQEASAPHSAKRPPVAAQVAVGRALALAEASGRQLHVAHLSTGGELALVRSARARGVKVTCEIAPQHLFLSTHDEERLGPFGVVNPPLRSPDDVAELWARHEDWDMIATDHAPHTVEEKQSLKPPSGMPGLETMLPLLLTAAREGRLKLERVAELTSRNPARVFLLSRKGELAPGYDADLVFVRLDEEYVLAGPWHTRANWSPYEGRVVRGRLDRVLLRGQLAWMNGEIQVSQGFGKEVDRGN